MAVGFAAFGDELGPAADWSRSLLFVAVAAVVFGLQRQSSLDSNGLAKLASRMAILFPAYAAFQLVPLPAFVVRVLSPQRSEIMDALRGVTEASAFFPLSIEPSNTYLHLSRIAAYGLMFLLVCHCARRSTKIAWRLTWPLLGLAAIEAAWGLAQRVSSTAAMSGSYGNRDHFSSLLEMLLPLSAIYAIDAFRRSAPWHVIHVLCLAALSFGILLAILFSLSKMGFVSMVGSFVIMGLVWIRGRLRGWQRSAALAVLSTAVLAVIVFLTPTQMVQGVGEAVSEGTAEGRWPIWNDTLHLIAAYPLFGSGAGTYFPGLLRYQTAGLHFSWQAHNDYLQSLSELGVVGFLIPAILIASVLMNAVRVANSGVTNERRSLGFACTGSMAAILIHSTADFNLYIPANALVLSWIAGLAAALSVGQRQAQAATPSLRWFSVRGIALGLGCMLALYAGAWLSFLHWFREDATAEAAFCRVGICDSEAALESREKAHGSNSPGSVPPEEVMMYLLRDPAGAYNWCDVGESLEKAGRIPEARYCFARAVTLAPHIPYMLFRAALFQFDIGEQKAALELLARAAEADPPYEQTAFSEYETRKIATSAVLNYGLPHGPEPARLYLARLMEKGRADDAAATFEWMIRRRYLDDPVVIKYIEFQIREHRPESAFHAWTLYAGAGSKGYPEQNRIFNGDFESAPSGSRFDWTISPPSGAKASFDHDIKHSGTRSLRVQFDGTQNVGDTGIRETVFLKPGRYRFRAYVRTEDISTDQGMSFRVADEESPNRLNFTTEALRGSHDWTLVEHVFDAPAGMGLVNVSLVRRPSLRLDYEIKGTMWVDEVSITGE